jgi:hypothetical protein
VIAAGRVFLFAAAFPFFNNMDEQAHVDLVLKYARGYWPSHPSEPFDADAAELFVMYGTLEYVNPTSRFPGGTAPPPLWQGSREGLDRELAARVPRWVGRVNHEAHSPPLYYLVAGLWYDLGGAVGLTGGRRLYWVRFLNIPSVALLVWCTYLFCRSGYPQRRELHIGVPMLAAFLPFDAFYSINGDAIAPLLCVISLLAISKWHHQTVPRVIPSAAVGFLTALNVLLKYTNAAVPCVFIGLSIRKALRATHEKHGRWAVLALCCGALCAVLPIVLYVARNYFLFGDVTGTRDKIEVLGWTRHTLADFFRHPIFTFAGFSAFWTRLMQTLWRGEIRWHLDFIASPTADAFYVISSSILLAAAALAGLTATWQARRAGLRAEGDIARPMCWSILGLSVSLLAVLSASFDYGACFYPSREFPYLASGRLIGVVLIPLLILYLEGAAYLFGPLKRVIHPQAGMVATIAFAAAVCLLSTITEAQLTRDMFANPYNWFHLPPNADYRPQTRTNQ